MKVILCTCSFEDGHRSPGVNMDSHYPLGLGYLHSVLEAKGHDVKMLFFNDYTYIDCALHLSANIIRFKPDAICFNVLTMNRTATIRCVDYIHYIYPDIKILLGGIHATIMAEQMHKLMPYTVIVKGEGENIINDALDYAPGIYQGTHCDVNQLPMLNHNAFWNQHRTTACLLTSRGCPFSCNFCILKSITDRKVRFRTPESVVDEIEYCAIKLNAKRIWIHDDAFTLDNERTIKICKIIIKRGLNKLIFICSSRVKPISHEMLMYMEMAGFKHIMFGLETGDPDMMATNGKCINQDDVVKCHELMAYRKMQATYFLIAGLPGETDKTVENTANFVNKLQKIKPIIYGDIGMAMVYPGSELYNLMVKSGKMTDDYWLTDKEVPYFTAEHSLEELTRLKNKLLARIT
jgi:radical SAM superfamily enzyme YgiQ (UPF0313 family)